MVRKVATNLYEVTRSHGFWFWKQEHIAMAYWYVDESDLFGSWYWVEDDTEIMDPDVRVALSECDIMHKRKEEEAKWKQKK